LNRKNEALTWLEKAFELHQQDMPRINNNPYLDNLRNEHRFLALIEKMGLTPYHTGKSR